MRSIRLLLLVVLALGLCAPGAFADHYQANCPLGYVGSTDPASPMFLSPYGTFRNGNQVYILRGQTLTTLTITELGDLRVAREDFISSMANHDDKSVATYMNGFMFVAGEEGLEIFDLRNVREGGSAPILVSRTHTPHYRRLTVMGNQLAAIYPANHLPCSPDGVSLTCTNSIDIYDITNLTAPTLLLRIPARPPSPSQPNFVGFNDVEYANGYLWTTAFGGTWGLDTTTAPGTYRVVYSNGVIGSFLESNRSSILAIGQDTLIGVYTISGARLDYFSVFTLPSIFNHSNELMFHNEAYIDDSRLITMIDERDPHTREPARTIAFDAFDFSVPFFQGQDDRIYENVSMTFPDEVKFDPILVGPFVHVIGEISGTQKWGACDEIYGHLNFDFLKALPCGGAELHGYVTGKHKITSVELFLGSSSLGFATLDDQTPGDAFVPIRDFRITVNLDDTVRGEHLLRAVATDQFGQRRQFYANEVFFPGPGQNCTTRKRGTRR
jgi:hypothetical protein